jgi:hypothetical protein
MAGGHVRLPTPPTTRARAAVTPKKARPRRETAASTMEHLMARFLAKQGEPSSGTGLLARDNFNPRKGTGVRRSPRGPFETKRAPQAPMPRRTLERHEPMARDDVCPLKGTGVRRSPRGPFETKRAPQAPMPRCITDQRLRGWLAQAPPWSQMPGRERLAAAPHHFY